GALARGLPFRPIEAIRPIQTFAPHLRDDQFRYIPADYGEFPDVTPLLAAGIWILSQVAENAVARYDGYYGGGTRAEESAMLRRLHADLDVTASKVPRLQ